MEIRLNKLISEAGVCSRREADNFIEMERVTVNGKQPHVGQKVTAEDVVLVDGERLNVEKYIRLQEEEKKEMQQEKELTLTLKLQELNMNCSILNWRFSAKREL